MMQRNGMTRHLPNNYFKDLNSKYHSLFDLTLFLLLHDNNNAQHFPCFDYKMAADILIFANRNYAKVYMSHKSHFLVLNHRSFLTCPQIFAYEILIIEELMSLLGTINILRQQQSWMDALQVPKKTLGIGTYGKITKFRVFAGAGVTF